MAKRIKSKLNIRKAIIVVVALLVIFGPLRVYLKRVEAAPWSTNHTNWMQRKQITLTNNSGSTLNTNIPYQINVDTKVKWPFLPHYLTEQLQPILTGIIDEFKVFGYPLNSAQVKNVYNNRALNYTPATGSPKI